MTAVPAIALFKSHFIPFEPVTAPVSLLERRAFGCAFPLGEAGGEAQRFCGVPACAAARRRRRSYCQAHYDRMGAGAPEIDLAELGRFL